MGWFDQDVNSPLDDIFDFDRDGKLNLFEQSAKYEAFRAGSAEDDLDEDDFDEDSLDDDYDDMDRDEFDDYDDDPDRDEFEDDWDRNEDDYGSVRVSFVPDRSSAPRIRREEETEADREPEPEPDREPAPERRYLAQDGEVLFSTAVKENFDLPFSLPDEQDRQEYKCSDVIKKAARWNHGLALSIWDWCLERFLPMREYNERNAWEMTAGIVNELSNFPEHFDESVVIYMESYPEFTQRVMKSEKSLMYRLDDLIVSAIRTRRFSVARELFAAGLERADGYWRTVNSLTTNVIEKCTDHRETESMTFFQEELFPMVKALDMGMVQDEIPQWEQKMERVRYGWREYYRHGDYCGLNPDRYETQAEFVRELDRRRNAKWAAEDEQRKKEMALAAEGENDATVYIYCGVIFDGGSRVYHYRTEDETVAIGDRVTVPATGRKTEGTVVSVGRYLRVAAPYPPERTKMILGKATE